MLLVNSYNFYSRNPRIRYRITWGTYNDVFERFLQKLFDKFHRSLDIVTFANLNLVFAPVARW
ncbi:MAG: hypothetical protein CM15mP111_0660 [Hyphomicrobiales bacterium]|nr:MAG: hypothetical protein CM15mP111_0660 [Hyphomicrobiales bacterium]